MNSESAVAALHATLDQRQLAIDDVVRRIQAFAIETPSWGYGNSGTRFKVFAWPGAARNLSRETGGRRDGSARDGRLPNGRAAYSLG